jgi:hypothetical protein
MLGGLPGPAASRIHALQVKQHVIPDRPQQRQVRNTPINSAQQAEHSGIFAEDRLQVRWRNCYTDSPARAHEKRWRKQLPHFPQARVVYFHGAAAYSHGSDPKGSAECFAKFAMEEKPERFRQAEPGGKANDDGSADGNDGCQVTSSPL